MEKERAFEKLKKIYGDIFVDRQIIPKYTL